MECTCIRHTELPHTSRLFADFVYHFDRVHSFYPHHFLNPGSYAEAAREMRFPGGRRAALVEALAIQNGDSESLRRLAEPETVAVVTGQQVGLFSGPAYTLYKALTAVRLARRLSSRGIPAVPVFWLATEDHDFAEIGRFWTFDSGFRTVALDAPAPSVTGGPVGDLPLVDPPIDGLRRAIGGLPHGEEVAALVAAAYSPGATLGSAFRTLLQKLLEPYGLLFVDPMLPAIRELAAPFLAAAIPRAGELTAHLLERNRQLADAGYHAQVHLEEHTSLFFLLENGQRVHFKRKGDRYFTNGRSWSAEELAANAAHLSPNALLRPVVQDSILPTVAYIGGPAELAYLAQSEVIYREVLGRMPVVLPRAGFTLVDSRSAKLMKRYGLELRHLFEGDEAVRDRIASVLLPPAVAAAIREAKAATHTALEGLSRTLASFDSTLDAALSKSRGKIGHQLTKIERKVHREAVRRDQRASDDAGYLMSLLYPEKHLQERLYSIVPFLARHGLDLVDRVYESIDESCPDHRLLIV
jgi:bacillithiol biosynthesis cysteine-adding enzyme BshC